MMTMMKKILLPTDLSNSAELAVPMARKMAATFGARIHCLHVADDPVDDWVGSWSLVPDTPGMVTESERIGFPKPSMKRLRAFVDKHFSDLEPTVTFEVVEGKPHEEIVRVAEDQRVNLIVMGNHGYGEMDPSGHDCNTERVIRSTSIPVLSICEPVSEFVRL